MPLMMGSPSLKVGLALPKSASALGARLAGFVATLMRCTHGLCEPPLQDQSRRSRFEIWFTYTLLCRRGVFQSRDAFAQRN